MERLTFENELGICIDKKEDYPYFEKVINKLKYYEDLEEDGKIIKPPCKVGDILYCVIEDEFEEDGYFISEEPIVEVGTRGVWISSFIGKDSMDCFISYDEFGKDVFLNKEDIRR